MRLLVLILWLRVFISLLTLGVALAKRLILLRHREHYTLNEISGIKQSSRQALCRSYACLYAICISILLGLTKWLALADTAGGLRRHQQQSRSLNVGTKSVMLLLLSMRPFHTNACTITAGIPLLQLTRWLDWTDPVPVWLAAQIELCSHVCARGVACHSSSSSVCASNY